MNPFQLEVPRQGRSDLVLARRVLEPLITQHMEGFGAALEGREAKDPAKRMWAHVLLRSAVGTMNQACEVARIYLTRQNGLAVGGMAGSFATEAALSSSTLQANVTSFITQQVHRTLDVYPRLIAPRLCSVQPFTQPFGYVFYMHAVAKDNGSGGTGAGRNLATLSTFDKHFGDRAAEGDQVKAIGFRLDKELVEVSYMALLWQHSWELEVALRSQYGLDIMAIGDQSSAQELAWEVDRKIVDGLTTFALTNPQGTVYFDPLAGGAYAGYAPSEKQAYDRTFISKTLSAVEIDMSASIYVRPNWYLCGVNVAKLLARTPEGLATENGNPNFDQALFKGQVTMIGTMKTGELVLMDPQLDADTMIVGHVDNMDPFYAGYIFCPFGMASLLTAAFQDPDVLLTKKSRALAFAQKGVRNTQFRVIKLGTGS